MSDDKIKEMPLTTAQPQPEVEGPVQGETKEQLPTMQELAERMNHEFSLIRVRAAAIGLKKEKLDILTDILKSEINLTDEKKEEMRVELISLAESILAIVT